MKRCWDARHLQCAMLLALIPWSSCLYSGEHCGMREKPAYPHIFTAQSYSQSAPRQRNQISIASCDPWLSATISVMNRFGGFLGWEWNQIWFDSSSGGCSSNVACATRGTRWEREGTCILSTGWERSCCVREEKREYRIYTNWKLTNRTKTELDNQQSIWNSMETKR